MPEAFPLLTLLRYIGTKPIDKETGLPKPHVKGSAIFHPDRDYVTEVGMTEAQRWVRRWRDLYEFVQKGDLTVAETVKTLEAEVKKLTAENEELRAKPSEDEVVKNPPGRPRKDSK